MNTACWSSACICRSHTIALLLARPMHVQVGAFTLTYRATDSSGNVATLDQTVQVLSPCPAPESLCLSSCACSTYG